MICTARMCHRLAEWLAEKQFALRPLVWGAVLLMLLPGLGLRTWVAHSPALE